MTTDCNQLTSDLLPCLTSLKHRARALTHNDTDAADLFQDTIERALRAAHSFRRGSNLQAWLRTIMKRRAIDLSRTRFAGRCAPAVDVTGIEAPAPYAPVPWEHVGPAQLRRAIACLPDRLRVALVMRLVEHVSCRVIAERLAIPIGTVHSRLLRARHRVRQILQEAHRLDVGPQTRAQHGTPAASTQRNKNPKALIGAPVVSTASRR